jgi:eukaryotic-like serine/threonine-protein kinase
LAASEPPAEIPSGARDPLLNAGAKLGPYQIISAIGAGGMGEVYRARDTRLNRTVAIKVLPTHLADRSELRERFEREARTIASLNHPHICTLYDVGHQDGTDFLVMEYLEGETLAQRLMKGPPPLEQVLQYAIEIADALDKAHRKGVTHRDLKPGNIMLTKSGTKLLDFGLAKLAQEVAPAIPDSQLPTMKSAITGEGTILGTLQYMAPEQVEAKEVDTRTDIFAFGAVIYEMATGRKAFEGKTSASVMAKIMEAEPPSMASLTPMTPPALDRVVKRCLAKDPDRRWQTASDLCEELKWIAEGGSQAGAAAVAPVLARANWRKRLAWAGAGLVVCAMIGLAVWTLKPAPTPASRLVTRFTITLPAGQHFSDFGNRRIALSPDGARLAYSASQSGGTQLYLRAMDRPEGNAIPGTEAAEAPFFSPDGQWVGFFANGTLKKVSVNGGAPVSISEAGGGLYKSASWGPDGTIVFDNQAGLFQNNQAGLFQNNQAGLFEVPAGGGTAKRLTTLDSKKGEGFHFFPEFLPDGKTLLFTALPINITPNVANTGQIVAISPQTGQQQYLIGGVSPSFAPTGQIVYAQGGILMAVPFDSRRLAVTGSSVPVLDNVQQSSLTGVGQYSFSKSGSLVYLPGGVAGTQRRLVWVDRKGAEQPLAAPAVSYRTPRLSPDGRRVAVATTESGFNIWLYDLARGTLSRLTFTGSGGNVTPTWTPDGKRVTFTSSAAGSSNPFWQPADGSSNAESLTTFSAYAHNLGSWSPDGQTLAFEEINPTTKRDVWVLSMNDHKARPLLNTQFNETAPQFSPDSRWLAYASDESGRYEIYVQPYPGPGGKWQVSTEGGTEPVWARNGELFYRSGDKMMAVQTTLKPSFSADKPKVLFQGQYVPSLQTMPNYDVAPDGQRFLMVKASEQDTSATQINVVLNWFEELKQKVPTGKK